MKAYDVQDAADAAGLETMGLCAALRNYAIPLLEQMQKKSGLKFWLRISLSMVIGALKGFVSITCTDTNA